jgi:hypothetical protein
MAEKVGIWVVAKDMTGKAFSSVAKGALGASKAIAGVGRKVSNTALSLESMAARWGQITGIISAASDAMRRLSVAHVETALEFRKATDPMAEWYEEQGKSIKLISARIGDIWLPVLKGLSDAIDETTGSTDGWIAANRELIAMGIIDQIRPLATMLGYVVRGIGLIRQGIVGIQMSWLALRQIWSGVVKAAILGLHSLLGSIAKVSDVIGIDGLTTKIYDAQGALVIMGRSAQQSGDDAVDAMFELQGAIDGIKASTETAVAGLHDVAHTATRLARAAVEADTEAGRTLLQGEVSRAEALDRLRAASYLKRRQDALALAAEEDALAKKTAESYASTAVSISESFGVAFGTAIAESKSLDDATKAVMKSILGSTIAVVRQIIMAYAAEAAAGAFKGHAGIPIVGVALGTAAAAAALGIGQSFVQKMALGGEVKGGVPGRDTVPIIAMPGETVRTPTQSRRDAERDRRGGSAAPMTLNVSVTQQALVPDAEMGQRAALQIAPYLEAAIRDGQLRLGV